MPLTVNMDNYMNYIISGAVNLKDGVASVLTRVGVNNENFGTKELKLILGSIVLVPVVYCAVEVYRFYSKVRVVAKSVDQFPGPATEFLLGNIRQHPGPNEKCLYYFTELAKQYKTCHRMWFGPYRGCIVTYHPDTIKVILKTSEPKPFTFGGAYQILTPWLGYGLLTASGNKWARNRRLLTPGFHFDVLKPYIHIYNEAGNKLADMLQKGGKEGSVEIFSAVGLATLHTVMKCAFSFDENIQDSGEKHPYVTAVGNLSTLIVKRMFCLWQHVSSLYRLTSDYREFNKHVKYVHGIASDIITKRRKILEAGVQTKQKYPDFLDILLLARDTDGTGLTDEEIRQEVDTFLFEGHDTTASAISWTLYSLAQHPAIQQQVRQEVNGVLQLRPDGNFENEDLNKLPYLTQCLKEGMRMHSPVPFIGRELSQELTMEGKTLLPGTFIDINICTLHHNVHVWGDDHDEYKPERFSAENVRRMDPHAFLPFSAGQRNCIGQNLAMGEMKVLIAKVLTRFELSVDVAHPVEKMPNLVMRAKHGIKLNLTPI